MEDTKMLFQIIAVVLLLTFYGAYFAKLFHQKKQGIKTDLLGRGKKGFVKFIEITLKCATYLVLVVEVVSIVLDLNIAPVWLRICGAVIGAIGVFVFIISVLTMRDSWRAGVPVGEKTELVTDGIYRFSRNPAFLGFDLIYIGVLLLFFNFWLLSITLIAVLMLHLQIVNVEEDFLIDTFGEDYLEYKKTVCHFRPTNFKIATPDFFSAGIFSSPQM